MIELRLEGAHAAAAKPVAFQRWRNDDGRIRGAFKYHGAHTGRWSSFGIQVQNLKRPTIADVDAAVNALTNGGDLEQLQQKYPQTLDMIGSLARAMICAPPGYKLIAADYSGIESRVAAWLSRQRDKVDQWAKFDRTGNPEDEPYFINGQRVRLPKEVARDTGKVADLAFNYMGSIGAWKRLAPPDDETPDETIYRYRDSWRAAHLQTVQFWYALDRRAIAAIKHPNLVFACGRVKFSYDGAFLFMQLPSGRKLAYPEPRLQTKERVNKAGIKQINQVVVHKIYKEKKWTDYRFGHGAYGGTWMENAVSAIARDLLAAAMLRLEAAGYKIVMHVHDEIVVEIAEGFGSEEEFRCLMTKLPDWAEGLPIAAKIRVGQRFSKTAKPAADETEPTEDLSEAENQQEIEKEQPAEEIAPEEPAQPESAPLADKLPPAYQIDWREALERDFPHAHAFATAAAENAHQEQQPDPPPLEEEKPASGNGRGDFSGSGGYPRGERDFSHARHSSDGDVHGDSRPKRGRPTAQWFYPHLDQSNYLRVDRHDLPNGDRHFYQHHWDGTRWVHGVKGTYAERKIPYRLPELKAALQANPDVEVQICEGESDADALARLGFVVTTNPGGALSWSPELTSWLRILGVRRAVIHEDNDGAAQKYKGQKRSALLTAELSSFIELKIVRYPDVPEGEDVRWWLEHGHTKKELEARVAAAEAATLDLGEWDAGDLLNSGSPEPRQWLMSRHFCRGFLSGLVAPGDAGKTTLRLTQAIELATGRELLGHRIYQRCRVLVVSFEDDREELHRRLAAICQHHRIDPTELKGWLFCRELNGAKLVKLHKGERQLGELDTMLRRTIERRRPGLIILDPFVKLHALDENNNPDMDFVCSQLIKLAQDYELAIDSPAHTRKGPATAGHADLRRGASAQRDAGRLDYTLTPMSEDEAKRFSINPEERKSYVRLDRAKANIVRAIKAEWFRLVSVNLGNATELYPEGDDVQAIETWVPPETWAGVTAEMLNAALDEIDAGLPNGQRYSDHSNAAERVVWPMMQKHCPDKSEAQCREIFRDWVNNGVVLRKEYNDPIRRKKRSGLFVNNTKRPGRRAE